MTVIAPEPGRSPLDFVYPEPGEGLRANGLSVQARRVLFSASGYAHPLVLSVAAATAAAESKHGR